jgi:hypothetical protein
MRAICPVYLIAMDLVTLMIGEEKAKVICFKFPRFVIYTILLPRCRTRIAFTRKLGAD